MGTSTKQKVKLLEAKTPATMMIRAVIFATLVAMALGLDTEMEERHCTGPLCNRKGKRIEEVETRHCTGPLCNRKGKREEEVEKRHCTGPLCNRKGKREEEVEKRHCTGP